MLYSSSDTSAPASPWGAGAVEDGAVDDGLSATLWDDAGELLPDASEEARVLVAVVPSQRDWEIVQREGWYRIPVRRAPARIGAEYLAFYHTKAGGALRWSVACYAPILRYRIVTRRELLPDEPDHPRADELYLKLELGQIMPLPRPIPSHCLRRVTFIHTTLVRLFAAEELNDLWVHDSRQQRLWRAARLRERPLPYLGWIRSRRAARWRRATRPGSPERRVTW